MQGHAAEVNRHAPQVKRLAATSLIESIAVCHVALINCHATQARRPSARSWSRQTAASRSPTRQARRRVANAAPSVNHGPGPSVASVSSSSNASFATMRANSANPWHGLGSPLLLRKCNACGGEARGRTKTKLGRAGGDTNAKPSNA